jgi:ADP-heptose:LPS heptosyltransferase
MTTPASTTQSHTTADGPLLLIHGGAHGDLVLAVTFARALQRTLGCCGLRVLCRSRLACYLAQRNVLDAWKSIENPGFLHLFTEHDLPHAAQAWLNAAACTLSLLGDALCARHATFHIDPRAQAVHHSRHILTQWADQLVRQGGPQLTLANLGSSAAWLQPSSAPATANGREVIVHPGSGSLRKCWPLGEFITLAEDLRRAGDRVRFMIGPAEQEAWAGRPMTDLQAAGTVIAEADICRAAEHLEQADLYIGNDSGLTHLAARLGLCVVALFVDTEPTVWQPLGPRVQVLRDPDIAAVRSAVIPGAERRVRKR